VVVVVDKKIVVVVVVDNKIVVVVVEKLDRMISHKFH
jgi:hypothetical protein